MHGMSGMDAAKELRKTDADCLLVFTTTSTDHALEGFQVRALHYLVKPFSEEELSALLAEMLARLPRPEPVLTGEGQRQRCPPLLPGHYLGRAFCTLHQYPHDRPENAGHTPKL